MHNKPTKKNPRKKSAQNSSTKKIVHKKKTLKKNVGGLHEIHQHKKIVHKKKFKKNSAQKIIKKISVQNSSAKKFTAQKKFAKTNS